MGGMTKLGRQVDAPHSLLTPVCFLRSRIYEGIARTAVLVRASLEDRLLWESSTLVGWAHVLAHGGKR